MKKITLLLFLICAISLLEAQTQDLEDITLEMLREKQSSLDSSAVAEVLYEKGNVSFSIMNSWEYKYEVVRRIKIYSPEGYDQANVQIPYFVGETNSDEESVSNIDGFVYYESEGKIEREKIRNRDVFEVALSDLWEAKKFTLPKIQDGVIIEYSYTINSPHISNLPKWVFQDQIPTRYSEYVTNIPVEYLIYNARTNGFYAFDTKRTSLLGSLFVRSESDRVRTKIEKTQSIATNISKIENEPYVSNVTNYLPSISYELSSFKRSDVRAFESVSRSWDDVVKTLRGTDTYSKELSRTKYFEDDLNKILKDKTLPKAKMNAIFNFVKAKMTWNDEERRYTSDKLDNVYKKGVGNSADINVMLTAMLRAAGLQANPVFSSTIDNGIPIFPTISGFNYVFTHVMFNGEEYLLDATDKFSSPNILPKRLLNWTGTIMMPVGFETIDLIPAFNSLKKYQVQAQLSESGEIKGKCRIISKDHYAIESRSSIDQKSKEDIILNYERNFNATKVSNVSNINLKDSSKPFIEGFSFSGSEEFVEQIGDKFYLSPMLFLRLKENPFKKEKRIYPIDFVYPRNIEHYISISIPDGYEVSYIPKQEILIFKDGISKLTYLIEENNQFITVKVNHEINTSIFLAQDYKDLRDFYISLMNKENEKIVLVKS